MKLLLGYVGVFIESGYSGPIPNIGTKKVNRCISLR